MRLKSCGLCRSVFACAGEHLQQSNGSRQPDVSSQQLQQVLSSAAARTAQQQQQLLLPASAAAVAPSAAAGRQSTAAAAAANGGSDGHHVVLRLSCPQLLVGYQVRTQEGVGWWGGGHSVCCHIHGMYFTQGRHWSSCLAYGLLVTCPCSLQFRELADAAAGLTEPRRQHLPATSRCMRLLQCLTGKQ